MTRDELGKITVRMPQQDFATKSDDYLLGFQAGVQAALDAVSEQAFNGLPIISVEQGLGMRTGHPEPNK